LTNNGINDWYSGGGGGGGVLSGTGEIGNIYFIILLWST